MVNVSMAIRQHVAKDTLIKAIKFVTSCVLAPTKKEVLAYLGIPTTPGEKPSGETVQLKRMAETDVSFWLLDSNSGVADWLM
jgi:primary-amine oxidase